MEVEVKNENVEEEDDEKKDSSSGFKILDENIFIDAIKRKEADDSDSSLAHIMHDKRLNGEYTLAFEGQTKESVPQSVITDHLIPYMREFNRKGKLYQHRVLYMASGPQSMFEGAMLTVDENGNIVRVNNWGRSSECSEWLLNIWPLVDKTDEMRDMFDEYSCGSCACVEDKPSKEEIERRFWIAVFGKVFRCCWWHYKGYEWLS